MPKPHKQKRKLKKLYSTTNTSKLKEPLKSYEPKYCSYENLSEQQSITYQFEKAKSKINKSQDKFFCFYDALKEKIKDRYADSLKYVEKMKTIKFLICTPRIPHSGSYLTKIILIDLPVYLIESFINVK